MSDSENRTDQLRQLKQIEELFHRYQIEITEAQAKQFLIYYQMLTERNKAVNLTAITEFGEVIVKHFLDSAMLLPLCEVERGSRVIDIGTGAGFPGIPLKILRSDLSVTLLDSLNKRVAFLDEVIERLGLEGIQAVHARAEDLARDAGHRGQYDLAVSRAVASLNVLSELSIPFLRVGGRFIPYKSVRTEEELAQAGTALRLLGADLEEVRIFHLEEEAQRTLLLIRKRKETDKKYPRRAGIPSKKPL